MRRHSRTENGEAFKDRKWGGIRGQKMGRHSRIENGDAFKDRKWGGIQG